GVIFMDSKEVTKKRLEEIEQELELLKKQKTELEDRWKAEKNLISEIRAIKVEIENVKHQAEELERKGELSKVAELRYGKLYELSRKLDDANQRLSQLQKDKKLLKEEVTSEDIAEVISKSTGIPVQKMLETEKTKLVKMEERIKQRVVSQDEAITAIANAIRRSRSGLADANRPIGSFIFLGTTGVGKTETARALAEFLFDDENAMIRIDMSEYMEKFSVSRLIGAPPGYVGYEEGGQLTEAVRRRPYSVILLDEIEKAHSDVFNVLLQVLDDGRLTDSKGRTVNFKNTIIIMTSNLGTEIIQSKLNELESGNCEAIIAELKIKIIELLKRTLRPEFLNRVDEIVMFNPLTKEDIREIAKLQLKSLFDKLSKNGINAEITDAAIDWLATLGYDIQYGARPLKRAIQKHLTDPLAVKLLSGEFSAGDTLIIDCTSDGKFLFNKK
ncbi:MAG TPA: AAA family ATPase, partial [Candidatus Kapabacteria bacterium]|nr:AAA family ATPase [Candidatus Kapabacteria bacterium]